MLKKITVSALVAAAGVALYATHAAAADCPVKDTITFSNWGGASSQFHVSVARYIVEKGWGCKAESRTMNLNALAKGDQHISMETWGGEIWDGMKATGKVMEPGGFVATADPAIKVIVGMNRKFAETAAPITAMLSRYRLDADTVDEALVYMEENRDRTGAEAAAGFLRNNEAVWTKWVPADVAAKVKAALAEEEDALLEALFELAARHERESDDGLTEEQILTRLGGNLCHAFSQNDFPGLLMSLKNGSKRRLGREVPLEEAYFYTRCYQPVARNCDLLRVVAEDPLVSDFAGRAMIRYFTEQTPNQALLGKIVRCRRDFGFGCVDVLEHLETNANSALWQGYESRARMLIDFKTFLLSHLNEDDLKHDRGFCRQFLDEPRYCGE